MQMIIDEGWGSSTRLLLRHFRAEADVIEWEMQKLPSPRFALNISLSLVLIHVLVSFDLCCHSHKETRSTYPQRHPSFSQHRSFGFSKYSSSMNSRHHVSITPAGEETGNPSTGCQPSLQVSGWLRSICLSKRVLGVFKHIEILNLVHSIWGKFQW